tara:strand:+ start:221 stop:1423 length:1203 start_codon:yes stop_codon:yes gene_type:complete
MPHKGEDNMKVELYIQTIKSHPDSNNPKRKEHTAIVNVVDLWKAEEFPTDANPRDQKMTNAVTKGIAESLKSNDGLFRYKNQGITVNCESVKVENDPTKPMIIELSDDPEDQHGVINGGHTYRVIRESCEQIGSESSLRPEEELATQTVLVRFFSGIKERESVVSIAEGQNSSVAVTKESLIHMGGGFDDLIKKLPEKWENEIQFKQNELKDDGKTGYPMDSRDLLGLIWSSNSERFPTDGVDKMLTRPYSSKSSLVKIFENDKAQFGITKKKLNTILELRDYILCTAEEFYNDNGGRFGSLRFAEKFSKDSVVTLWSEPDNTLNRGAFLPIFSSFRIFEEKDMFDIEIMKKAWEESGNEIILKLLDIVEERESITEVGKDSIAWGFIAKSWERWLGKTR